MTSLDHTIREGNSVISDSAVHPKALDWQTAFPEVFAQGGFDVVVGNPPYIRQELLAPFKPYWEQRFKAYHGVADIFVYFFEQGVEVLRPGDSSEFLIFARRGIRIEDFPAVHDYLEQFRAQLEPKPPSWNGEQNWPGRKAGAYQWYELQDTVDYWEAFEQPKIVWPDISKLPRFSMDTQSRYLGNTGYVIPGGDYYLLGILSSPTNGSPICRRSRRRMPASHAPWPTPKPN